MKANPAHRAALLGALVWGSVTGGLLLGACASDAPRHTSHTAHHERVETTGRPNAKLLLGVHRTASLLLGDAGLRTVLGEVRLRVGYPSILERSSSLGGMLVPASSLARDRLRRILERAFAGRITLATTGPPGKQPSPTHTLESSFIARETGVEIKLRLVSVGDEQIVGKARVLAEGADLSFLEQELTLRGGTTGPAPRVATSRSPAAPVGVHSFATVADQDRTTPPVDAIPRTGLAPGISDPPSSENVPDWIYEILSEYPNPTNSNQEPAPAPEGESHDHP